ncbi:MAG: ParB N-terminal domain-containing protein [Alphaproteobacteria bacterium]|jgi:ParB family transcriptional regulator, chromosome partitioning protein|nr:ParB N-terminal domain-containing protein [Alphaproteobacteria bacterium]MBU2041343.1 ParB N-terminal domain-containing protein [Alphaproteobacteria bacterium]MBU2125372.1 ParB N-terminal domain-containing protein [Alphaproteobacteria bacterium]MBU2209534.1 ParB N-terminal domain-containing protein [Alphaproteobacteria bacterium]MBU2290028.1 ParB N-terminal domain-containing protein [Alphaproteobacteria bacterium]
MTAAFETPAVEHGVEVYIPLNRLKKSERNARKTPHRPEDIETLAASIRAKGILQPPVVEPELDAEGRPTGNYLVTIGEGRRLAQLLRAKRKQIKKTEPIRCVIDTANDAYEISLDENVTRFAMHPADQFEAFQRLAEERGFGAEEIAARFGVTATVVRQRLKLASVSPRLMQTYRDGDMTLDQLMAFTVSEDHQRQEGLWESLPNYERHPQTIRRHLTRDRVSATDRRAIFVGAEAYQAAGGVMVRDLFADDQGGYFADPALLDRLVAERLQTFADAIVADGWKWASFDLDYSLSRIRPQVRDFTSDEQARYDALQAEREALETGHAEWTDAAEVRFGEIVAEIEALDGARLGFASEDKARAGAFITLTANGQARVEYGFVRPEDEAREPVPCQGDAGDEPPTEHQSAPEPEPGRATLSDTLVENLTAHRTAALRDALAAQPQTALCVLLHLLVQWAFDSARRDGSCLEVRPTSVALSGYAPGLGEMIAGRAMDERHEVWAAKLAAVDNDAWALVTALDFEARLDLLAYCVSRTVNAVRSRDRGDWGMSPADDLASVLALDMTAYWTPTSESYFGRVPKSRILEAVTEAVSEDAARRISAAKKADMADAAEQLIVGTGWLPLPLRTVGAEAEAIAQAAK